MYRILFSSFQYVLWIDNLNIRHCFSFRNESLFFIDRRSACIKKQLSFLNGKYHRISSCWIRRASFEKENERRYNEIEEKYGLFFLYSSLRNTVSKYTCSSRITLALSGFAWRFDILSLTYFQRNWQYVIETIGGRTPKGRIVYVYSCGIRFFWLQTGDL